MRGPAKSTCRDLPWSAWTCCGLALLMQVACSGDKGNGSPLCDIPTNFTWTSSEMLIEPISDATHELVAIKDPTVVQFQDRWHIYATTANTDGEWSLAYLNFDTWENAGAAPPYYMDQTPGFDRYMAAPHVFYFTPHEKWYLVFQSQPPVYSTTSDISDPTSWTPPQPFFTGKPRSAPELWIDYWVICDDVHCYLFFTGDNGGLYRSRTTLAEFPAGMDDPVLAMRMSQNDLFEGSATYKIDGMDQYLTLVEAIGPEGVRYYKAWTANTLDGAWTPIQNSFDRPFAGEKNVTFPGGQPWTRDISHGELLRKGYDERMVVDLCGGNMQFLYQGQDFEAGNAESDYSQKPYRLGLLTQGPSVPGIPPLDLPPTPAEPFPTAPIGDNLLTNPGFESGTEGWMPWGATLSAVDAPVHSGSRAGFVSDRADSWNGAAQDIFAKVEPGQTYFASIWVSLGGEGLEDGETGDSSGTSGAGTSSGSEEAGTSSGSGGTGMSSESEGTGTSSGSEGTGTSSGSDGTGTSSESEETGGTSTSEVGSTGASDGLSDGSDAGTTSMPPTMAQPVSLTLKSTCGSNESYNSIAVGEVVAGAWLELSGTFTAPDCADLSELLLYAEGPAAGIDFYVDDASLSK